MKKQLCWGCMEYTDPAEEGCPCGFQEDKYVVSPHHLNPGTTLQGRYVVGRVLGEGGFGITYVGRDTLLDLKVAVKEFYMAGYVNRNNTSSTVVRASVGSRAETFEKNRDKFLNEARVLAKFTEEDGIVGIRDFFQENNTAYIVMNFITGETLKEYVKREQKLTWQNTLKLMAPVLNSLADVHEQNVIHRDISPDNMMLTRDGRVKLLDFGAAREISENDMKSLSVILKPGFAPEEQYRSKGRQGPWTDIYALCATMYYCITGRVPEDAMERMFDDKLKAPHQAEPGCSVAVSNVIMKGMAVRQQERYQTIRELQADLKRAAAEPDNGSIAPLPKAEKDFYATVAVGAEEETAGPHTQPQASENEENSDSYEEGTILVSDSSPAEEEPSASSVRKQFSRPESDTNSYEEKGNAQSVKRSENRRPGVPLSTEEPSKPGKKKKLWPVAAAAILLLLVIAGKNLLFGGQSQNQDPSGIMPEALAGYEVTLNDTAISLPISYEELARTGWELADPADGKRVLKPGESSVYVDLLNVEKGYGTIRAEFQNASYSEKLLTETMVYGLRISDYSFNQDCPEGAKENRAVAPGEIQLEGTTEKEFLQIYTQDYGVNKVGGSISYIFREGTSGSHYYQFSFIEQDGEQVLSYIGITNLLEEAQWDQTYETERPALADEAGFSETAAEPLYLAFQREEDGKGLAVYQMPLSVYVQDYLDDGWSVEEGKEYLAAGASGSIRLRKDARTVIEANIYNPFTSAIAQECCMVSGMFLKCSAFLQEDVLMANILTADGSYLGISDQMNREEIIAALKAENVDYRTDDSNITVLPGGEDSGITLELVISTSDDMPMTFGGSSKTAIQTFMSGQEAETE